MKIAVIYNRDSKNVINLFGIPNREKYGKKAINRIVTSLKKYGHQVKAFEGDKDLISKLEDFMPRVLKGELPGLAFNLSYGIQGQARYTHVPSILEMVGIPYVGSNPLAHSLALDKVVAKMIFQQHGLPTPDFIVVKDKDFEPPKIPYPLIVKPKNEAVSMGIEVVHNFKELQKAAKVILEDFDQSVLVEQYIDGREINVGLLGNNPPEALPPCEITFGKSGPKIYTIEDKKGHSGRQIDWICPAPISEELTLESQRIARDAFSALGCYDAARVDIRLDKKGRLFILEVNSLPSLGEHGSYTIAAQHAGLDFPALINRMVEVASARYFGTPHPPKLVAREKDPRKNIFTHITSHRDQIEHSLEELISISSRTSDPVGNKQVISILDKKLQSLKMRPESEFMDERSVWTWTTNAGLKGGTLLIGHTDVPMELDVPREPFRRESEWLYGEGIGISRAPLVTMEFALRALRSVRRLHKQPLGIMYYMDEGRDCRYSNEIIKKAASQVKNVFVLRPGGTGGQFIMQRRGQRKYDLIVEGEPKRLGKFVRQPEVLLWTNQKLSEIARLSSMKNRLAVSTLSIRSERFPMLLPHRVHANLLLNYLDGQFANETEQKIREILKGSRFKIILDLISDRPPMKERRGSARLAKALDSVAREWEIPWSKDSSLWPSVGGLAPAKTSVICGLGPAAKDLYTPREAVNRVSLIQRTLLLALFLAQKTGS
ncbi:MAG: ATP-grasp domain-containing protein [Candidatus Aminicenantes bacterium]